MKVLITGGTGFIGSRLALRCAAAGHQVRVLGQENTLAEAANSKLLKTKGAEVVLASVNDSNIRDWLNGFEVVFHLAATQHEMNVPDRRFWDVNVEGTINILNASTKVGVDRFVHGSTIGVYGAALEGMLDESSATKPDNIYGITKLEGEKAVLSSGKDLPVTVVRISETYGPGDRRLLKLFKAINKKAFFMVGHGTNRHHLIYIDDLCEGLLRAATAPKAKGETFVLSGKDIVTSNEMVAIIADTLGTTTWRFHAPLSPFVALATLMEKTLRPLNVQPPLHRRRLDFFKKSFAFSQEKVRNVLEFKPCVSFRDGVNETTGWYRQMGYL
jgi:nucleoside-diphosphate-sugar epimerase